MINVDRVPVRQDDLFVRIIPSPEKLAAFFPNPLIDDLSILNLCSTPANEK